MLSNKVSEIMTTEIISVPATTTVHDTIERMIAHDVGRIIVTRDDQPVGIFTERHVLKHVANRDLPEQTPVEEVMTSPFRSVGKDTHIVEALGIMTQGKFRHLQVLGSDNAIVGIVSMRRILEIAVELGRDLGDNKTIGSLIPQLPLSLDKSASVWEAVEQMNQKAVGAVITTAVFEPVGIFTERDLLNRVVGKRLDTRSTPLSKVMTTPMVTMPVTASVSAVLDQMNRHDIRNMPIVGEWKELAGLVSMPDVLQYARAFDIDEEVRRTWRQIQNYYDSQDQYTPG